MPIPAYPHDDKMQMLADLWSACPRVPNRGGHALGVGVIDEGQLEPTTSNFEVRGDQNAFGEPDSNGAKVNWPFWPVDRAFQPDRPAEGNAVDMAAFNLLPPGLFTATNGIGQEYAAGMNIDGPHPHPQPQREGLPSPLRLDSYMFGAAALQPESTADPYNNLFSSDQDFNTFVQFLSQTDLSWVENLDESTLALLRESLPNQLLEQDTAGFPEATLPEKRPPAGGGIRRTRVQDYEARPLLPVEPSERVQDPPDPSSEDDPRKLLMQLWDICPRVPSLPANGGHHPHVTPVRATPMHAPTPAPPQVMPRPAVQTVQRSPQLAPTPPSPGLGFAEPASHAQQKPGIEDPEWPYSLPDSTRKCVQDFLHAAEFATSKAEYKQDRTREEAAAQAVKFQEQMIQAESNLEDGVSPKGTQKPRSTAEGSTISGSEESSTSPESSWSGGKRDGAEIRRTAEEVSEEPSAANERSGAPSDACGMMVMMCNLPNNRDAEQILAVMEKLGFKDSYDYFYLPVDRHCMCNKGYGFIHFMRVEDAYSFIKQLEGFRFERTGSSKTITACIAKRQGVAASLKACIKSPHRLLDGKSRGRVMSHCPWVRVQGQIRCLTPTSAYNAYVEENSRTGHGTSNRAEQSDPVAREE
jgi:hypothetical protein